MTRLNVFLDPNWRTLRELFSEEDERLLRERATVFWGRDDKASAADLKAAGPEIDVLIAATPEVDADTLDAMPRLKTVVEVSGAFPGTIDYTACADRGIEVLSCAPGFRQSVAEMCLAMMLAGGRGLMTEHEAFRNGEEHWLSDNDGTDFTLFEQQIGFVGYGSIAREVHRLLRPFASRITAFDPWLPEHVAAEQQVTLLPLDEVMRTNRCTVIAATPTSENRGMIGAHELRLMPDGALIVVISRAHLVDFDALVQEVSSGRIRAAIDVFPNEPVPPTDPIRSLSGAILSPHRAAAVPGGRQLIGRMILADVTALSENRPERQLLIADANYTKMQAGVGDAKSVGKMALRRDNAG